jgi:uncharacterized protein YeaO (DUF488 family)
MKAASTRRTRAPVKLKRAYEPPAPTDGIRVLVDRLWPRGLDKRQVAAEIWLKDSAPSDALRRWFGHDANRWDAFRAKYRAELARRGDVLARLDEMRRSGPLTLVYSARDEAHNQAVVLREVLEERGFSGRNRTRPPSPRTRSPRTRKGDPQ